jgi:hypothetical protein
MNMIFNSSSLYSPERLLAQTERPADIVRRRLEQCGYDPADGLELLGADDLSFLLKFVYKSQLLGPAVRFDLVLLLADNQI